MCRYTNSGPECFVVVDGGASSQPCSDTYAGSSAFSEPEMKSLSEFITSIKDDLVAYIGFHSYSQLILIPYGDSPAHVENFDELVRNFYENQNFE